MIYIIDGIFLLMWGFSGLIFISILLSWFPMLYNFKLFRAIRRLTDAYMEPFHGMLVLGVFDFTPIIGIVLFDMIIKAYAMLLNF